MHVPFCASRCPYCDYAVTVGALDLAAAFVDRTLERLQRHCDAVGAIAGTASVGYIGGGTPSLLSPEQLSRLVAAVAARSAAGSELTVELNPEHLSPQLLERCASAGATRVSLGVQVVQTPLLHRLGRAADGYQVARALAGLASWGGASNVDVLAGVPGQRAADLRETLRAAADATDHITLLELTGEGQGAADQQDLWLEGASWLRDAGFEQYETVHFGRAGGRSRYVVHVAQLHPLVAVGPGAEGLLPVERAAGGIAAARTWYGHSLAGYLHAADGGYRQEPVDGRTLAADALLGGLRLAAGVERATWRRRFGAPAEAALDGVVARWQEHGLAVADSGGWRLTANGALRSDGLAAEAVAALPDAVSLVWP